MAEVRITVDLDANQATQVAGKLSQVLAEASINGARLQVGNPEQAAATVQAASQLNEILKQIYISVQKVNIALAKTGKQNLMMNSGLDAFKTKGGKPNKAFNDLLEGFDNIIKESQEAIKNVNTKFVPAVENIQPAAEEAKESIQNIGTQSEKSVTKGSAAFTQAGQRLRRFTSAAEHIANSFVSPFTIALIAFEAGVKTFTYFWNNLTESIQKMTTRAQAAIKAIQRKQKVLEEETKISKDLVKQLEDLNKQQNLSIDQQRLAQSIIARLNKQYKDLGITLDETTGKYTNLYEAQRKIDERNRRSQANTLQKEITAQRDIVNAALANAFGRGISLDKTVNGSDFFTLAEKIGGTLGAQNADLLAKKWNTKDLQKQLEVIDQLIQGLSSSDQVLKNGPEAIQALQTLIDYRQQLQELNSVDTQIYDANRRLADSFKQQADAIKKAKDQLEKLTQNYQDQQRANSLAGLDPEDRANAIRGEIEQLEKRNQVLQRAIEYGQKQATGKRQNSDQALKWLKEYQKGMKQAEDTIKNVKEQMDETNKFISKYSTEAQNITPSNYKSYEQYATAYRQNQANLQKYTKAQRNLQQELVSAQKQLNGFKKAANDLETEYQEKNGITLQHEEALAKLEQQRQQNLNAIQQKQQQVLDIEKQIAEQRAQEAQKQADALQKQAEAIDAIYSSYQKQLESYNKTDFETKIQDALQNAQKSKGSDLTREEIDQIIFYVTQLEKMNELEKQRQQIQRQQETLEGIFTNYEQQQVLEYMKLNDMRKEALLLEAKLNAEKALGRKLTEDELKSLQQYIDRQMMLEDASKTDQKRVGVKKYSDSVISNDLASKGGFASSIVVDRSVEINEQILQVQKSQKDLLSKMSNSIEKYSVIQ